MRDADVRHALHRQILSEHTKDPNTLVLDELGLDRGVARIDIAVVNGRLHGYEIKSDADTLQRLPGQIAVYSAILDNVTLVMGCKHADEAMQIIPSWWGVKFALAGPKGGITFKTLRRGHTNPAIVPERLASLLWQNEAVELLQRHGVRGVKSKNRHQLGGLLAQTLSLDMLREEVRACLKARVGWRSG